ncbi:MAG: HEAT repeat domain-containing protein [Terrimicrobiaceae bacterium]
MNLRSAIFLWFFVAAGTGFCSLQTRPPAFPAASPTAASPADQALERARLLSRPALLYFQMQGCSWCRKFETEVLSQEEVKQKLGKFEIVKVDLIGEQALARSHGVRGAPAFVVLTPAGAPAGHWTGFLDREKFLALLETGDPAPPGPDSATLSRNSGHRVIATPPVISKVRKDGFSGLNQEEIADFVMLMADEKMRPLVDEAVQAKPPPPAPLFVPLLRHRLLAVRLGALQLLEDQSGENFGFDAWAETPAANADALRRWEAWAAGARTPGDASVDPEFAASRINDLLSDDDVRSSRGFRALMRDGADEALSHFETLNPGLSPEQRNRLRELRFALILDSLGVRDAEALAHRLLFGNLDVRLQAMAAVSNHGAKTLPILESFLSGREPLEREAAVDGILRAGGNLAVPVIANHLGSESDTNVLHVALRKLGDTGGEPAARLLEPFLKNPDEDLTVAALESLARMEAKGSGTAVQACLKDPRWRVRVAALKTASKLKLADAHDDVKALLSDPDEFVRISAVGAASEMRIPGTEKKLGELFVGQDALKPAIAQSFSRMELPIPQSFLDALENSPPETVLAVIGSLPDADKKTEPLLRWAGRHKNEDIACAALRLIAARGLQETANFDVLTEALRSGNPRKVQTVLFSASIPRSAVVQEFPSAKSSRFDTGPVAPVEKPPDTPLQRFAAAIRSLNPGNESERLDAAILLAQLADPASIPPLKDNLKNLTPGQRLRLATALAVQRNRETRPIFGQLLDDPDSAVRRETVDSLFEDDAGPDCADLLLDILEKPGSRLLPHEAMHYRLQSHYHDSGGEYRTRFLRALKTATDPALRIFALSLLGNVWGPGCADAVGPFTTSGNPRVRRAALFSLGKNEPSSLEKLRDRIAGDSSPYVRAVLPGLLTDGNFPWKTLFSESESHSTYTQNAHPPANRGLGSGNETLVRRLADDPDSDVRLMAHLCLFSNLAPLNTAAFVAMVQQDPNGRQFASPIANVFREKAGQMPEEYSALVPLLAGSRDERATRSAAGRFPGGAPGTPKPGTVALPAAATPPPKISPLPVSAGPVDLVYFTKPGCSHCARVKSMLARVSESFPELRVTELNINKNQSMELNETLSRRFGVPENLRLVAPAIFTSAGFLVKDDIGEERLGDLVLQAKNTGPLAQAPDAVDAGTAIAGRYAKISAGVLVAAGVLDGLNPCAFATIIFLLSYLQVARKTPREMALIGIAYVAGVFSAYFLLGLGLSELVARLVVFRQAAFVLNTVMGLFALLIAVLSFRDGVRCLRGRLQDMSLQLPDFLKKRIRSVIRGNVPQRGFVFGAFGIGAFISLLELACTGQVYAPTILYMMQSGRSGAAGYLALYNLAFILPLSIVFVLALLGLTSGKLTAILQRHAALVKFGMAILFLFLAFLLFAREWQS